MRSALAILLAVTLTGTALAQGRPNTLNMSCAEAAATVASYGSVVLSTGINTYDRFVAHVGFCLPGEYADQATAPTLDTPYCGLGYTCEQRVRRFNDNY